MIVAGVQHDIVWEDRDANYRHLGAQIERAAQAGARLILLSEMFPVGFSMRTDVVGEPKDGPSAAFLTERAHATGAWVGGSVPERSEADGTRPFNQFVLAGPEGTVHRYAKIHPFTYGHEDRYYAPGNRPLTVTVEGLRVTPFVCYDLRFADVFWAAAPETDVYVIVANWPASRQAHWSALLVARAIENQAYVVGVNRVGSGGGLDYCGGSVIIDPFGETVAAAGDGEEIVLAEIDPERVRDVRSRYPFLVDRR